MIIRMSEGPHSPTTDAMAPDTPRTRAPNTMTKFENRLQSVGRGAAKADCGDSAIPDDYRRRRGMTIDRMAKCQIACYRRQVFPWPNLFDRSERRWKKGSGLMRNASAAK